MPASYRIQSMGFDFKHGKNIGLKEGIYTNQGTKERIVIIIREIRKKARKLCLDLRDSKLQEESSDGRIVP